MIETAIPLSRLKAGTHRLIASRYPTVGVFDDIAADEADLRAAFELEDLTNGRAVASERLARIPGGAVAGGPGASLVMAAFLHCDAAGARFSDGRLGAWYASTDLATALEETVHHHERRLRASAAGFPNRIQMRQLLASLDDRFIDLRGLRGERPELYHPTDYSASQAFAIQRRWPFVQPGAAGVIYDSVRREGGVNVGVFKPASVPPPVVQGDHFDYVWDARGQLDILKITNVARG